MMGRCSHFATNLSRIQYEQLDPLYKHFIIYLQFCLDGNVLSINLGHRGRIRKNVFPEKSNKMNRLEWTLSKNDQSNLGKTLTN